LIKPTLLQWCIQAKGGTRCPSAETNHLSVIRGSSGSVGINWPCVTVVAFRQLGWSISIFYPVGQVYWWLPDRVVMRRPPSANCGCTRFLGAGWTLTFSVASGVVFLAFLFWPLEEFSGPERDDPAAEEILFLAGCLFLLGGFIMIPDGYGFV
jgi:hypothetical protein